MILIVKIKQYLSSPIFLLSLALFIPKQSANAEEVFVYCAADKDNWHWLSNQSVSVKGEWRIKRTSISSYIKYFKIDGGFNAVLALQKQCKQEFGPDYKYAQPADNYLSGWHLFGVENASIVEGIFVTSITLPRLGK